LRGFPNLKEWSTANDGDAFSKLRKLIVDNCPILINMPRFPSLQHLELRNCNQAMLSIANFTSLLTLATERIPEIHSISGSFLAGNTFLTSLEIISCPKLILIPSELGSLAALKSLTIRWCGAYVSAAKFAEPQCFRVIGD
jgi:structure-specific endonuclease subunit SLX1